MKQSVVEIVPNINIFPSVESQLPSLVGGANLES
jgi:hypothetical protein